MEREEPLYSGSSKEALRGRHEELTVTSVPCNSCVMPSRKEELLDATLRYLVRHGVADASLRPIAAATGTSARILMFHFGSKEGLLRSVMQELHERLQKSLLQMPQRPGAPPLKSFWDWASSKNTLPYFRLLYELQILAVQNPQHYGAYVVQSSLDWQKAALRCMSTGQEDVTLATLCIAVFDGLMLELITTGQRPRVNRALDRFLLLAGSDSHISEVATAMQSSPSKRTNRLRTRVSPA